MTRARTNGWVLASLAALCWTAASGAHAAEPRWAFTEQAAIDLYNQAMAELDDHDGERAEQLIRQALALDPEAGVGQLGLAVAQVVQNRPEPACASLSRLAGDFEDQAEVHMALATCLFVLEDFPPAVDAGRRGVALSPGDPAAVRALLDPLLRLGRYDEALAALEAGRKVEARAVWACLELRIRHDMRDEEQARALLPRCAESEDEDEVANARAVLGDTPVIGSRADAPLSVQVRAQKMFDAGARQEAIAALSQHIETFPNDLAARIQRGWLHHRSGDRVAAYADLEAVYSDATWVDAHSDGSVTGIVTLRAEQDFKESQRNGAAALVVLALAEGEIREARKHLSRGRKTFGDGPQLAAAGAALDHHEGAHAEGWARFLEAQVGASELAAPTVRNIGSAMARHPSAPAPPPEVLAWFLSVDDWVISHNAALAHNRAGEPERCLATVEAAVAQHPEQAELLALRHRCALDAGQLERADGWLRDPVVAAALEPDGLLAHAHALTTAERHADALALLTAHGERPMGPSLAARWRRAHVLVLVALDRLDDAMGLADGSSPEADVAVGVGLAAAERLDEAARFLERACPAVELPGMGEVCTEALEWVKARPEELAYEAIGKRYDAHDWQGCLDEVDAAVEQLPELRGELGAVGYACAVRGNMLDRAAKWLGVEGVEAHASAPELYDHAFALYESGAHADALARLDRVDVSELPPDFAEAVTQLRIGCLLELGRRDEVDALCSGGAPPSARAEKPCAAVPAER